MGSWGQKDVDRDRPVDRGKEAGLRVLSQIPQGDA